MKKLILGLALALLLVVFAAVPAFADTSDDVSVTATPSFISISVSPDSYDIGGTGAKIAPDTTYYANPGNETSAPSETVLDAECAFTITNSSTVATDITVNFPDFSSGDAMTNINTGYTNNGANQFGVSGYVSGDTWPADAVILKSTGSDALIESLAAETNKKFGWALLTQSGAWSSGTAMTSTVSVAATAA